jgi:anti-anti-sigma factor
MLSGRTASGLGCLIGFGQGSERAKPASVPFAATVPVATIAVVAVSTAPNMDDGLLLRWRVLIHPVLHALSLLNNRTSLQWKPKTGERDWNQVMLGSVSAVTTVGTTHRSAGQIGTWYILFAPARTAIVTLQVTTSRIEPDIVALHLAGSMAIGAETYDLEWLLRDLLRQGERKLIFDLTGVDQIDADAALFMVRCFFTARGSGGELRFAAASPSVVRPFRATTLDTLLPFDPTVTAAYEHFTGRSSTAG